MKKILALLLAMAMVMSLVACGSSGESEGEAEAEAAEETEETESEEAAADYSEMKIGLLLSGSANDGGWSQMAADAVTEAADQYPGITTNFSESLAASDFEAVMRGYADQGYNIIVAHGSEFLDVSKLVAADYPDITFINTSAQDGEYTLDNLTGLDFATYQLGFISGAICALATENGKVGSVGSMEIDSLAAWVSGIEDGINYIDSSIEFYPVWSGSFDDALKGKQAVDSLHELGVDVVTCNSDAASIGVAQQCAEYDMKHVGGVYDLSEYGDTTFVSVNQDAQLGITMAIEMAIEGSIPSGFYSMGADVGVINMTDYVGTYADCLTDDEKAQIADLLETAKTDTNFESIK